MQLIWLAAEPGCVPPQLHQAVSCGGGVLNCNPQVTGAYDDGAPGSERSIKPSFVDVKVVASVLTWWTLHRVIADGQDTDIEGQSQAQLSQCR